MKMGEIIVLKQKTKDTNSKPVKITAEMAHRNEIERALWVIADRASEINSTIVHRTNDGESLDTHGIQSVNGMLRELSEKIDFVRHDIRFSGIMLESCSRTNKAVVNMLNSISTQLATITILIGVGFVFMFGMDIVHLIHWLCGQISGAIVSWIA